MCLVHMRLIPWSHDTDAGFTLRGWHSPPSGKPLLHFLHGNGFCGRTYEAMLKPLSSHFDLWLSDVQGHGDSDHGGPFLGWNRSGELAMKAFEAHLPMFGKVPCYAVGHSFGGVLTCLALADHPRRFTKAVVLDPVIFSAAMAMGITLAESLGLSGQNPLARSARKRRKHWSDRETAFESLHGRGTYKGWREDALQNFVTHALKDSADGGVELKCRPSREAEIFSSAPTGLWTALRHVETPTLLIHAVHTFPFVISSAQQWAETNPKVQVQQVSGGHCFMQERPDETAAEILSFLTAD
jgi:pimeloyl-ACP methyl ester carboxylesterase